MEKTLYINFNHKGLNGNVKTSYTRSQLCRVTGELYGDVTRNVPHNTPNDGSRIIKNETKMQEYPLKETLHSTCQKSPIRCLIPMIL